MVGVLESRRLMAVATVLQMMNGDGENSLHPFFRKANGCEEEPTEELGTRTRDEEKQPATDIVQIDGVAEKSSKPRKTRKSRDHNEPETRKKQKTLQDIINPKAAVQERPEMSDDSSHAAPPSDSITGPSRRKRRRTSQHESVEVGETGEVAAESIQRLPASPRVIIPASSPLPLSECTQPTTTAAVEVNNTPPKKVLKLKANGKFSSPVSKSKQEAEHASPGTGKRRGRPRRSKEPASVKELVVRMCYNRDETGRPDLGQLIDRILSGEERIGLDRDKKQTTPKKQRTPKKANKNTHPFFLGKPKEPPAPAKQESPRKASATTPGKLRRQIFGDRISELQSVPEVSYHVGSALLKDRLMVKHPGARDPPWPDREQSHVRGLREDLSTRLQSHGHDDSTVPTRKHKSAQLPFPQTESLLEHFASNLTPEADSVLRADGFREPHPNLILPEKLLITGQDIRQRVGTELSVHLYDDAEDELSLPTPPQLQAHPALRTLWDRLPNTLTSYDEGRGEPLSWSQKYAPLSAEEVLQPAREMTTLRKWLASLTVTAVEGISDKHVKQTAKPEPKPKKRRRRKPDDLDDFLVDDDEDLRGMDQLTDPEDVDSVSTVRKSMIQVGIEGAKLTNAVLLSGPAGCGKTAAAYAVAKQLGFRVFEINAHERRSGRDVLDKVGDMTENHLVQSSGQADGGGLPPIAEEPNSERLNEAFERDLASGRQGKMSAFFKPKAEPKPAPPAKQKPMATKINAVKAVQNALKKPPRDQQQSLILLEEVDILFKEDKEFWTTILKLIATSKRPFIMTCNDEDLVPLQAMSLHAILRFSPPPVDLAVDHMLLIAATEGHLLNRSAVADLYRAKQLDLRASITELDIWCQMGIGDPRGGLSWIYQRWPPGSDLDAKGRRLRVVSQGTFHNDMASMATTNPSVEECMMQSWQEYGIEPTDLLNWNDQPHSAVQEHTDDVQQRLSALKAHGLYADALSSMDAFTAIGLPQTAPLDATQPDLLDKARGHYIEGLQLLQTDDRIDHANLSMQLAVATVSTLASCLSTTLKLQDTANMIQSPVRNSDQHLTRHAFACFDAISVPSDSLTSTILTQSTFDGPITPIATDLAPYVRSIVQYDLALEEFRERISDGKAKRARTTRAARSALEGSQRGSTRRERWFAKSLDLKAVLATGGGEWPSAAVIGSGREDALGEDVPTSSAESG